MKKKQWIVFFLLLALGLFIRLLLIKEPINSDPMAYMQLGARDYLGEPGELGVHHQSMRLVMGWLVGVPALFFGYSLKTYYIAVYFSAFLSGASLIILANVLFGWRVAVGTGLLWAGSYAYFDVDTMIIPDNLGASLIYFATSILFFAGGGFRRVGEMLPSWGWQHRVGAFFGGLLVWTSWATRETFIFHIGVVCVFLFFLKNIRKIILPVAMGGAVGVCIELFALYRHFGDPFIRIKYFLGIDTILTKAFENLDGGDLTWFLLRYPKLLHYTGSAEFVLMVAGIVGGGYWLKRARDPLYVVGLLFLVVPFGFSAFLVRGIHPITPFLEELVRYYASCVAFFYMAASDVAVAMVDRCGKYGGRVKSGAMTVVWGALAAVIWWNLDAALKEPYLVVKGYDAYAATSRAVHADAEREGRDKRIYRSGGLENIRPFYFPEGEGWVVGPNGLVFARPGYFIANWRRLNQDGSSLKYLSLLDDYPLLFRHTQGLDITDTFLVGPEKMERRSAGMVEFLSPVWSLAPKRDPSQVKTVTWSLDQVLDMGSDTMAWSGEGDFLEFPTVGQPLPGDRLLRLSFLAKTPSILAEIKATVEGWETPSAGHESIFMGRIFFERLAETEKKVTFLVALPHPLARFRLVLHTRRAPFQVRQLQLMLLHRHPLDGFGSGSIKN